MAPGPPELLSRLTDLSEPRPPTGPRRWARPVPDGTPPPGDGDATPVDGTGAPRPGTPLWPAVVRALADGPAAVAALDGAEPRDEHDLLVCLTHLHALHGAPLATAGPAVRWQHHPAVAGLTWRLEGRVLAGLEPELVVDPDDPATALVDGPLPPVDDAVAAMRSVAARDLVPDVYRWLATRATRDELVDFLAVEGGPDAGFDDLVAACQIGLSGAPKLELARNYWDEMGRGDADGVHTVLHDRLVAALDLPRLPVEDLPTSALLRGVLGSLLVRHRWLQPELVGALGLLELQAGPRCRQVVRALRRVGAPADAFPFYAEHAEVDPHHGKAWLDHAVGPLAADPAWAARMVRGARWRSTVNHRFFADLHERFTRGRLPTAV